MLHVLFYGIGHTSGNVVESSCFATSQRDGGGVGVTAFRKSPIAAVDRSSAGDGAKNGLIRSESHVDVELLSFAGQVTRNALIYAHIAQVIGIDDGINLTFIAVRGGEGSLSNQRGTSFVVRNENLNAKLGVGISNTLGIARNFRYGVIPLTNRGVRRNGHNDLIRVASNAVVSDSNHGAVRIALISNHSEPQRFNRVGCRSIARGRLVALGEIEVLWLGTSNGRGLSGAFFRECRNAHAEHEHQRENQRNDLFHGWFFLSSLFVLYFVLR